MKKECNKLLKYLIITSTLSSVLIGSSEVAVAAAGLKKYDKPKLGARKPRTKKHEVNIKALEVKYEKSLGDRAHLPLTPTGAPPSPPAGAPPPPPPPKASKPLSLNPMPNMADILGGERKKSVAKQTDKGREIEREFQKKQKDLRDKIVAQGRDLFDQLKARAQSLTVSTQEISNDSLVNLRAITANKISNAQEQVALNEKELINIDNNVVKTFVNTLKREVNSRLDTARSELATLTATATRA